MKAQRITATNSNSSTAISTISTTSTPLKSIHNTSIIAHMSKLINKTLLKTTPTPKTTYISNDDQQTPIKTIT